MMKFVNLNEEKLLRSVEPEIMRECCMFINEEQCDSLEKLMCKKNFCPFFKRNLNDKPMSIDDVKTYILGKKINEKFIGQISFE